MEQKEVFKVICSWCNEIISEGNPGSRVSHGICNTCSSKLFSRRPTDIRKFLNRLDVPVIIVDQSARAQFANTSAEEILGKKCDEIKGQLGGDVFECIHARKPGGCGRTEHCKACIIRKSVEHTYATGEALFDVPATLRIAPSDEEHDTSSVITTVRAGETAEESIVYLTISDFTVEN
ncbi:MAG: PAS domain-containing protein [Spirochaetales bacterium]|nr:PAS domain-containing protein [Spirochaetales bacterium]